MLIRIRLAPSILSIRSNSSLLLGPLRLLKLLAYLSILLSPLNIALMSYKVYLKNFNSLIAKSIITRLVLYS